MLTRRLAGLAWLLLLLCGGGLSLPALAAVVEVPVAFDYRILEDALRQQVFTGPDGTAEVFADESRCNTLVLAEPRVGGGDDGRIRLLTSMQARAGTPLFGKCWFAKSWAGQVETLQAAQADPATATVSFRVVDSTLLRSADGEPALPGFMQRWINDYVHPRLQAVTIDLGPAVSGIREVLDAMVYAGAGEGGSEPADRRSPLRLAGVRPSAAALVVTLSLDIEDAPVTPPQEPAAPLSDEELAEWDAAWQDWDAFATWLIKTLALQAGPELTAALAETLLEARYDLRDALAREDRGQDPVRALFLKSWERLAPLVRDVQLMVPGSQALPYAAFVGSGDALAALDRLAPHLGMRLNRDSLRVMARLLMPTVTDYQLRYDTAVDPELRLLLGFDPGFEEEETAGVLDTLLSWLVRSAHAAWIRPELVSQLNGWVPARPEIDRYLQTVEELLEAIAGAERDKGKVPAEYFDVYDSLLRATAWQESCWRQFVERDGSIEAIRSPAGSVGLMQVNLRIWRGVYDPDQLEASIAYNARAGNEILVHYLVDYAIARGEHDIDGDPENLARAAYAVYNGGPRHLTRYRKPGTTPALKKIDNAFWAKYRAIQHEGPMAVKRCLAG